MTKMISVSDDAYRKLASIKGNKSFSKAILELTEKPSPKSLLEFVGIWKNDVEAGRKAEEVYKERKRWKLKRVEF